MGITDKAIRSIGLLMFLSIGVSLLLAYRGVLYQTGAEYYHVCCQSRNSPAGPSTPEQAAQWSACEPSAEESV